VGGVSPTPAAVLAQLEPFRIVPLALIRLVIPALALFTGESCGDPDISAGHLTLPVQVVFRIGDRTSGRVDERRPAPMASLAGPQLHW
jgi:hypothetical protein